MQSNYDTMNNKENFGGDMDDIEEISEMVDDNSRFVYTDDENSPSHGSQSPQEVYMDGMCKFVV